nr:helix-turn-helix domain-containing protein [Streptomyces sp. TRM68416]
MGDRSDHTGDCKFGINCDLATEFRVERAIRLSQLVPVVQHWPRREEIVSERNAAGRFDAAAFHAALDRTRQERGLLWKDVAKQAGVSASTLTRLAQGRRPDVDGLAALVSWANLSADDFVRRHDEPREADTLAKVATHLRGDRNLTPEAADALEALIAVAYKQLATSDPE